MNKVYNIVWNVSLGLWCVTSELAKSKTKMVRKTIATSMLIGSSGVAFADSVALGGGSVDPTATDSVAIGASATVDKNALNSIAIGANSEAKQIRSIAIGDGAISDGLNSTAIGEAAKTSGNDSVALGTRAQAYQFSTALGEEAAALGQWSLASGFQARAEENYDAAFGFQANASGGSSLALGFGANSSGNSSTAIGSSAFASGARDIALGAEANATGGFGAAIGYKASKSADRAFAIGDDSKATANRAFAFGNGADASDLDALALGSYAGASAKNAIALGQSAKTDANSALTFGNSSHVTSDGSNSLILGNSSIISAADSFAAGNSNSLSTSDTFALGNNITTTLENSIFLGSSSAYVATNNTTGGNGEVTDTSITNKANNTTTFTNYAGSTAIGVVSVGNASGQRRIQNVAAGLVAENSTDAINGSQLYSVANNVAEGYNFSAPSGQSFNLPLGSTFNLYGTMRAADGVKFDSDSTPVAGSYSAKNIQTVTDGKGGIQFQLADNPNFENVTSKRVTVGPVIISNTGIDLGGQKITHVQAGTKDDDAVNVSQLNNVKNIASAGWNIQTDSGKQQISNIGSNNTMAINGDRNISVTNNGNNVSVSLNNDIMLGSDNNSININGHTGTITAGSGDNRVAINGNTGSVQAGNVIINGSAGKVNGLTNLTWDPNNYVSGQAATEDQLHALSTSNNASVQAAKTEVDAGKNIEVTSYNDPIDGHVTYTIATAKDVKFNSVNSNSVNVGNVVINNDGINAGNKKITGTALGKITKTSHDAVNGSQLYQTNSSVANYFGGGATVNQSGDITTPTYNVAGGSYHNVGDALGAVDNKVDSLAYSTQKGFNKLNNHIDKVEKKLSSGIAGVAAMESAPYIPGKFTYAMGGAYYNEQSALGVTLRRTSDNGRWSLTAGTAVGTQGQPVVRVGISGVID